MKSFSTSAFSLLLIAVILMNALLAFSKAPNQNAPSPKNSAEPQHAQMSPSRQKRHTQVKVPVQWKRGTKKIPETNLKRSPEMVNMPKELKDGQSEQVQAGKRDPNSGKKKIAGHS
ncbi:uncharacterized protein FA14DRAFT_154448 [Meira miltonrushii]|uniref:Uncharacterized protein n=1 Tax=Meira miltonrushii TaxID=1280837 RepID=A0A316VC17_9BASI|nr:uncharacterized protein FA14DRAFT_154448 [Meira miltonrushii]PWN35020.1 hypothetical protein FA14DRAFT_154448 [Meira miltonrushii]